MRSLRTGRESFRDAVDAHIARFGWCALPTWCADFLINTEEYGKFREEAIPGKDARPPAMAEPSIVGVTAAEPDATGDIAGDISTPQVADAPPPFPAPLAMTQTLH